MFYTRFYCYYRDCAVPYVRHFHTGYSIFHFDLTKQVILHWIIIKYAISHITYENASHTYIRDCMISVLSYCVHLCKKWSNHDFWNDILPGLDCLSTTPKKWIIKSFILVYGPVTETLHPPGDFWRPLFLETLAIGLLKSGCLQKSQCWIKPWGRFFSKWPPNYNICLGFGTIFCIRQFSFSLMNYNHLGLHCITIKIS